MTTGLVMGVNAGGHRGWITVKCRLCALKMDVTRDIVYHCPKCRDVYKAYFCEADMRRLRGHCPYCKRELELLAAE